MNRLRRVDVLLDLGGRTGTAFVGNVYARFLGIRSGSRSIYDILTRFALLAHDVPMLDVRYRELTE